MVSLYVVFEQRKQEPIAILGGNSHPLDVVRFDHSSDFTKKAGSVCGGSDDEGTIDETGQRDGSQHDEPEPEEDEYLLVDDVQRQQADGIVDLNFTRCSETPQTALRHFREYLRHWIDSTLRILS